MSAVYASGVKATAIAAITAAVAARISVGTNGAKVLDAQGLVTWLRDEFNLISTTDGTPPGGAAAVEAIVNSLSFSPMVTPMHNIIDESHWWGHPSWPGDTKDHNDGKATTLLDAQRQLRSAVLSLQSHYEIAKKTLLDSLPREYEKWVVPVLPTPVVRNVETRTYQVTYVSDLGEESAPSPASDLIDLDQNDTVEVVVPAPPSGRSITHFRVYRSNRGKTGAAFQLVPNAIEQIGWPIGTLTITDDVVAKDLEQAIVSTTWVEPPASLYGIVALPNGALMGGTGARLHFSESFRPFAWPEEYELPIDFEYVGGAVVGNIGVALTKGSPYLVTGGDSSNMSATKLESTQACVSKRTICSTEGGVFYASPDGLCMLSASGQVEILTALAYNRDAWSALAPETAFGRVQDGVYHLFLASGSCVTIDIASRKVGTLLQAATAVYSDLVTDTLYVVSGTSLLPLFRGVSLTGRWRSSVIVSPSHPSFSLLQVRSDFGSAVTIRVWRDGVLALTASVTSSAPVPMPRGRQRHLVVEIEGTVIVEQVVLATSIEELVAAAA